MIFDIETDGLYPTKIHCLSYKENNKTTTLTSYKDIKSWLLSQKLLIGHNIIRYDIPSLERLLGIKIKARIIDTLALSWYLYPLRPSHNLDGWGDTLGVKKPPIDDWENLSLEEYIFRCESDVEINTLLWKQQEQYLIKLYGKNYNSIVSYLSFKMSCAYEQEETGWRVNKPLLEKGLKELNEKYQEVFDALVASMPRVVINKTIRRPKKPYKKSGELTAIGQRWFDLLKERNLPDHFMGELKVPSSYEDANPNSTPQVKDWLYSLGWRPTSFKYDGTRKIPQVRILDDGEKILCPSVTKLIDKNPTVAFLKEITVLSHRLGILKSIKEKMVDGRVQAAVGGLTNTLRFKHIKPCVNLPGVDKPYGELIRSIFIAEENQYMVGSDMTSLEATTKKHFMFPHDPDYVREMDKPGFDEHLDLAKQAGEITDEQIKAYQEGDMRYKPIRSKFKPANYACVYGVQAPRLARDTGMSVKEAQRLIDVYWERNWAVLKAVESLEVKVVDEQKWLLNPVSGFYYSLRNDKDKFSTLNQGTGVYCFDCWLGKTRKRGYKLNAQFHDEQVSGCTNKEKTYTDFKNAIEEVNNTLNLNVKLDVDIKFGKNYAEVH